MIKTIAMMGGGDNDILDIIATEEELTNLDINAINEAFNSSKGAELDLSDHGLNLTVKNFETLNLNGTAIIDYSVVVFDLTTGQSSDHSGRTFSFEIDYDIYIIVNSEAGEVGLLEQEQWGGASDLNLGDTVTIVGTGSAILGYNYANIKGTNITISQASWTTPSGFAAGEISTNGIFARLYGFDTNTVDILQGNFPGMLQLNYGFLTTLPTSVVL